MNKLTIIRGPLGIGKTTIAKRIAQKINGEYFSVDNLLEEMNLDSIDQKEGCVPLSNFLKVNNAIAPQIKQLIDEHIPVIIDGNFYHQLQIEDLIKDFQNISSVFSLTAPLETCINRDAARPNSYGKEATKAVYNLVSRFDYGQTIDTGNLSVDQTVELVLSSISTSIIWNGHKVKYTWIPTTEIEKYQPIRNVVGICLNDNHEVLICRETEEEGWKLPGGRPENKETPAQTLERELMEEVDIKVNIIKAIGTQRVDFPNNPKQSEGDLFYQVRYFCKIEKIFPQTIDPDTGILYDRKFIPILELNNYLKWGKIGEAIVVKVLEFENNK